MCDHGCPFAGLPQVFLLGEPRSAAAKTTSPCWWLTSGGPRQEGQSAVWQPCWLRSAATCRSQPPGRGSAAMATWPRAPWGSACRLLLVDQLDLLSGAALEAWAAARGRCSTAGSCSSSRHHSLGSCSSSSPHTCMPWQGHGPMQLRQSHLGAAAAAVEVG
jgi:hypothetical protein